MFGTVSLTLPATVGAREAAQLTRALDVLGCGPVEIVLHGAHVDEVTHAAGAVLRTAQRHLRHPRARLRVAAPSPVLRRWVEAPVASDVPQSAGV